MIQVCTFDKTVIDKKVLVAAGFFGRIRFAHKTIDIQVIRFFLYAYQLRIVLALPIICTIRCLSVPFAR